MSLKIELDDEMKDFVAETKSMKEKPSPLEFPSKDNDTNVASIYKDLGRVPHPRKMPVTS